MIVLPEDTTLGMLRAMVANSAAFQEEVRRYTEETAAQRVHLWIAEDPTELPMPFAFIEVEDASDELISGGDRNQFKLTETMKLWLVTQAPDGDGKQDFLGWYWEWCKQVKCEVLEWAGKDGRLNIEAMPMALKPQLCHEQSGQASPYAWMIWDVTVAGYT